MVADTHPVKHSGGHLVPAPISWVVTLLPLLPGLGARVLVVLLPESGTFSTWAELGSNPQHVGRTGAKRMASHLQGRHFAAELC